MKVLLDTSFLVSIMRDRIDLNGELRKFGSPEIFILDLVSDELRKLSEGKGKDAKDARLALQFLGRKMVDVIKVGEGNTDRKIMEVAEERGMTVCTIDRKLRDSLIKKGVEVITIRQGKLLERAM